MARAPSYDFERRERAKAKDAKRAAKRQAKRENKDTESQPQQGDVDAAAAIPLEDLSSANDE